MMRYGKMPEAGDVILANLQFTDTLEVKKRPAVILFEEYGNYVVAGITSNPKMNGVPITKSEGAVKNSVIKLNYLFTISEMFIQKSLFSLSASKKKLVYEEFLKKLAQLK